MGAKVREKISILFTGCASQVPEGAQPDNARSEKLIFLGRVSVRTYKVCFKAFYEMI